MSGGEGRLVLVGAGTEPGRDERLAQAIARGCQYLLTRQHARGQWQEPLESSAAMEAEYVLASRLLGRERPDLERRLAERILSLQGADGGWPVYRDGPGDLSTTVEAYFALKLIGLVADDPALGRARDFVLARGGLAATGVLTRFWLAGFGQFPWAGVPAMPVEILLLPPWAPFSIEVLSRARSTIVPLALLNAHPPAVRIDAPAAVPELWLRPPRAQDLALGRSRELVTWKNLLLVLERGVRAHERSPWKPLRRRAVARAIDWILRHQDASGRFGGTLRSTLLSLLALDAVGFARDHQAMVAGLHGADDLLVECEGTLAVEPAVAPVGDTALAVRALLDAGVDPAHPALERAGTWLVQAQAGRPGDWAVRHPDLEPGGWAAEAGSDGFPDVGLAATVLLALGGLPVAATPAGRRALAYGTRWTVAMQSRNGGYATFDTDKPGGLPFPDLEAALDPPSADVTGRVLELMAAAGFDLGLARARRAVEFLRRSQGADGSWRSRWGVNGLHGTCAALAGLLAIGEERRTPAVRRAVEWLVSRQNADGGWGESPASYADESLVGRGESTPSQTAWTVLGLLAADEARSEAVERGIDYLVRAQGPDGTWTERQWTGTGLPGRLYLRHHLHRHCFPLMALGRYRARRAAG